MQPVAREEPHPVQRVECPDDLGRADERMDTQRGNRNEPECKHRSEHGAHTPRPESLKREQPNENRDRDGHDVRLEHWSRDPQTLDGTQDGNRWRDDAVAVEHGRAEQRERNDPARSAERRCALRDEEGQQGEDASFATVSGAHEHRHVFHAHHEQQCPQEERDDAKDVLLGREDAARSVEGLLERVERTRPEVAKDDA